METFSALLALCAGNSPVPVNSPHKGQWRGALMFSLICARINGWVNNRKAGDLRRHSGHYGVDVMINVSAVLASGGPPELQLTEHSPCLKYKRHFVEQTLAWVFKSLLLGKVLPPGWTFKWNSIATWIIPTTKRFKPRQICVKIQIISKFESGVHCSRLVVPDLEWHLRISARSCDQQMIHSVEETTVTWITKKWRDVHVHIRVGEQDF